MHVILWAAGLWFGLTGCYVLVMKAQEMRDSGRLNRFWTANVLPWAVVGVLLDATFNLLVGTVLFLQPPRFRFWLIVPIPELFTARVQRHVDRGHGWRADFAFWWAYQLNLVRADHIKLPTHR